MRESVYQSRLIKKLRIMFPGCYIAKNNPAENQGIPDLLILFNDKWAALEIKLSTESHMQPNQEYYVDLFNKMSFAAFICPENEELVLNELQSALGIGRAARISQS